MEKQNVISELFERFIEGAYPSRELAEKALASRKLKIYLGIDPTGPHLHLGHATNLLVLKTLQKLGHHIILLIGDFTAMIGDPTDRLSPRQPLTKEEVKQNYKTFRAQAAKLLSFSGARAAEVRFNSTWYGKMKFEEVVKLAEHLTIPQLLARDMFQKRLKSGGTVSLNEFLYPLMQGYDSVALGVDMEIGGTDQTFNMLVGRDLMRTIQKKEKLVLTTKLLVNPKTGKKIMNKSEGGLVNLDDMPENMFGKVMALPDESVVTVAELSTDMPLDKARSLMRRYANPRDAKLELARAVVSLYHSAEEAERAHNEWLKVFSKREVPEQIEPLAVRHLRLTLIELLLLAGIPSKSEARRLIAQGAVELDEKTKRDPEEVVAIHNGEILKIGKRKFFKLVLK